ncbi:hypothetical protein XIS1_840038 [Xenorhabdus innexi]|uniref:Uncharacterized protein n=1 Tax=Xenorhabdus innexi TaxID=290109 RepID=A0A1N6N150_9GAMM|nr:hypothetical protein XIS1_840038 [Xenorhabdus innexi]
MYHLSSTAIFPIKCTYLTWVLSTEIYLSNEFLLGCAFTPLNYPSPPYPPGFLPYWSTSKLIH